MTPRRWVLLSAVSCLLSPAWGQLFPPEQMARIQQGLRDVYNLEHARAIENYQGMIRAAPDDPAGYAYLAFTYWVQELSGKQELSIDRFASSDFFSEAPQYMLRVDSAAEARFRQASEQAIEKARARLLRQPQDRTARFLLGLAYQNLASFEASLKRSWWAAFRNGSKTYRYHQELLRQDPNFHEARLATGVYQYVAGSLGWSAKWLALLLGYRGSRTRGKQELETAVRKATLVADDARIILTLIYTRERNYQRAFDYLNELLRRYPQNYLVHLDMGGMALLMKRPEAAITIYEDILRRREAGQAKYAELEAAYVHNRLGVAHRYHKDLRASGEWFRRALAEPQASGRSKTIARLELGKTLDLDGRRQEALEHYTAVAAEDIAGTQAEARELQGRPFVR